MLTLVNQPYHIDPITTDGNVRLTVSDLDVESAPHTTVTDYHINGLLPYNINHHALVSVNLYRNLPINKFISFHYNHSEKIRKRSDIGNRKRMRGC